MHSTTDGAGDEALGATIVRETAAATSAGAGAAGSAPERFRRLGELGRGGMGLVLEAHDALFGRTVALKELPREAAGEAAVRRFVTEALVTGNLEHPGIVAVYDRGVRDGAPYYAMRRLGGHTLGQVVAARRTLAERLTLLPAIAQVAHTAGYAHARRVVHRDIKPDNVMLGDHGEVVLLDWGLARVQGTDDVLAPLRAPEVTGADQTAAGTVLGTPAYMAPEQARGEVDRVDQRTDVFALGALLYHVLAGRPPYEGPTVHAVLLAAAEGRRTPVAKAAPGVSSALAAVVERAMAREPAERYPSAAELAHALEDVLARGAQRPPSRLAVWAALGAVLFAFFVVGLVMKAFVGLGATYDEQGHAVPVMAALTLASAVLGLVEWRTRARYRLTPLLLALAAATMLTSLASLGGGVSAAFVEPLSPGQDPSRHVMKALYEGAAMLATTSAACVVQLFVWALAARVRERAP